MGVVLERPPFPVRTDPAQAKLTEAAGRRATNQASEPYGAPRARGELTLRT